ncbi:MAG: hypothetical protein AB1798_20275, partial [Spirochaetota bacterium]
EVSDLPEGFVFIMRVLPEGPGLRLVKNHTGKLRYAGAAGASDEGDLIIMFKNIEAAMLVLTFRESTAAAFTRDRMIVKGDLSKAMLLVRCLNILEVYLLPAFLAKLAVKRYPPWSFTRKHPGRIRIYRKTLLGF